MKKSIAILVALIVLAVALLAWTLTHPRDHAPVANGVEPQNTMGESSSVTATLLEAKTSNEGGVEIFVQPEDVRSKEWIFGVVMDTHAGSLDADLTRSVTLEDEKGSVFMPIRWDGAPPGGHHRQGTLIFNAIAPRPDSITIIVRNIGGVAERKFLWDVTP